MNRRAMLANAILPGAAALPFTLVAVDPLGRRDRSRPGPSPDAALIDLCERHIANLAAVNAADCDLDDRNPAWRAYTATLDALGNAEPQTLAGMRAKALAAKAEALNPDGTETPDYCPASGFAWDLLNDLLRLTGGEA